MIPKDPVILLSYVNTQLRDYYESLEALCTCLLYTSYITCRTKEMDYKDNKNFNK